jgi:lipoate-protein ligase A
VLGKESKVQEKRNDIFVNEYKVSGSAYRLVSATGHRLAMKQGETALFASLNPIRALA